MFGFLFFFFFKQKTAYEISSRDWSSDVCSSDLRPEAVPLVAGHPDIDQVLVDDKRGADRGALGWLGTARRLRAEGFEVAVSPHRSLRTALELAAAGAPRPGRARGGAARRLARAARSRPAGGRGARLGVGDQALGAGGLRGRDRC